MPCFRPLQAVRFRGRRLTALSLVTLLPLILYGQQVRYLVSQRDRVLDDYHGVRVADPYRWLEDLNSDKTAA